MGVRKSFWIVWWDPQALVKTYFQNITVTNILCWKMKRFMKYEIAITPSSESIP